jgi:hypothetical protein
MFKNIIEILKNKTGARAIEYGLIGVAAAHRDDHCGHPTSVRPPPASLAHIDRVTNLGPGAIGGYAQSEPTRLNG